MERVRLGVIGAGIIVREKHLPALRALESRFEIVALCSRSGDSARRLAQEAGITSAYADYRQLLERPDIHAVDIAVPIALNYEISRSAAEAGKHVLCEKPLAASLEEGQYMLTLPLKYGIVLLPAENFRYAPDFARVREWVLAGAIGRPLLAHWQSVRAYDPFGKYVRTEWRQKPAHPGGYMSDAGVHYVDVLRATLGEVDTLYATMIHNWPILGSYDTAVIAMRTVSGTPCALVLSWAAAESRDRGLEIFGSEGTITANREEVSLRRPGSPTERFAPAQSEGFLEEFIDFHLAITEGKCPLMTPDEAYRDLAVMIAAIQSAQTKQAIDFAAFLAAHACPEAS